MYRDRPYSAGVRPIVRDSCATRTPVSNGRWTSLESGVAPNHWHSSAATSLGTGGACWPTSSAASTSAPHSLLCGTGAVLFVFCQLEESVNDMLGGSEMSSEPRELVVVGETPAGIPLLGVDAQRFESSPTS